MSLLEEHKDERRRRIQAAARKLLVTEGYDGLTMRDLARAARVSVPTLYNLFGSKDAILIAELEASAKTIAAQIVPTASFFKNGMAAFDAGMKLIESSPEFFRAVTQMALTSPETRPMRQQAEEAYIAIMAGNLAAAKAAGQLVAWAEPAIVARHMFALYMACFLAWSMGELDQPTFRAAALSGICHLLAGVARGAFAAEVEERLQTLLHHSSLLSRFKEVRHVTSRNR
jgi:TetR/AcrR family transcriptional regulator, cholesterol catabolism regulator